MKIGVLTFHYSTNYGGVLQCLSLYKTLVNMGYDTEVINFIPSSYDEYNIIKTLGINKKDITKNWYNLIYILDNIKKIRIKNKNNKNLIEKFNSFRESNMKVGRRVDEETIYNVLENYDVIIVGSDQVWNPSQRDKKEYFLDFGDYFKGRKISYAADSTIKEVEESQRDYLQRRLSDFSAISVRNGHSKEFVYSLIKENVPEVVDPTLLIDFNEHSKTINNSEQSQEYILVYVLGEEIDGKHQEAIRKIKNVYGDIRVYSIVIPTMNFEIPNYADKVYYDLGPDEWVDLFRNATFIYTDSFHGVLFSLKFHTPFLAYYKEKLRKSRFIDLGMKYNIDKFIVQSVEQIEQKNSLETIPNFNEIDMIIKKQKESSLRFIREALSDD